MLWNSRSLSIDLSSRALLLGILNLTPDSFSDGGLWAAPESAVPHALRMLSQGADILDIGGESTRPGALPISEDEELRRVLPVIEALSAQTSAPLSIDTRKPAVAAAALKAGASIVNDVGGLQDPAMRAVIASSGAGAIAMHMQGTPQTMQHAPQYQDVLSEIRAFFSSTLHACLQDGITPLQLVFDPGIGFGKSLHHNLQILRNLSSLRISSRPLALGVSRKSFLATLTGSSPIEDRLWPTVALTSYARHHGVSLLRVHDVLPNHQALRMTEAILPCSP